LTTTTLQIQDINKRYGDYQAVKALSFEVYAGEIFAILGPNGAGKTTTIRMILDIIKPDSGQIEVFGKPFTESTKNRIGYLPEERGLYKSVPVNRLLRYLGELKGMNGKDAEQKGVEWLKRIGLEENIESKVSELSRGMAQKVQFIATIMHDPEFIIIDEPFSGLDPVNTQLIKDIIYEMRSNGTTIMMSTHQMHTIEAMADRMLMISKGERVLYGKVDDVRQRYAHNAVLVQGSGDWQALEGVQHVEERGRDSVVLHLHDDVAPDTVMARLANQSGYHIRRYELAIPGLDEIFIEVANNGQQ
jgi:ABC-2 type transport system ATP-binding protein